MANIGTSLHSSSSAKCEQSTMAIVNTSPLTSAVTVPEPSPLSEAIKPSQRIAVTVPEPSPFAAAFKQSQLSAADSMMVTVICRTIKLAVEFFGNDCNIGENLSRIQSSPVNIVMAYTQVGCVLCHRHIIIIIINIIIIQCVMFSLSINLCIIKQTWIAVVVSFTWSSLMARCNLLWLRK